MSPSEKNNNNEGDLEFISQKMNKLMTTPDLKDEVERRRSNRFRLQADVMLTLLIPNETFSPFSLRGVALDVSIGGIRVKTYQLNKKDYLATLHGMSHAKLVLNLPHVEDPIHLAGRVVWTEFHEAKGEEKSHCLLGVSFYKFSDDALDDFQEVLNSLETHVRTVNSSGSSPKGVKLS
jgi:hypothetical protein